MSDVSGKLWFYKRQQHSVYYLSYSVQCVRLSLSRTHVDACVTVWLSYRKA